MSPNQRAERWSRLKKESPDTANFITAASEVFGKPKALQVKFKNEKAERWK